MKKIVIIDSCEDCPYYDDVYFTNREKCIKLNRVVKAADENGPLSIPEDCPLESVT